MSKAGLSSGLIWLLIRLNEWRKLHFPDLHEFFDTAPNRTNG